MIATLVGMIINFLPVDPMKALFWSAVLNGIAAVPIMLVMRIMAARPKVMGVFVVRGTLKWLGGTATSKVNGNYVILR